MGQRTRRRLLAAVAGLAAISLVVWFLRPQPVLVDLGQVHVGAFAVTVEEEARTRVRDVYIVSAPVPSRVIRSPYIAGGPVKKNETVLVTLRPTMPAFIDERSADELRAALAAAGARIEFTHHSVGRLESELELARSELARAEALAQKKLLSGADLEKEKRAVEAGEHALAAARAELEVQRNSYAAIEAKLAEPTDFKQPNTDPQEIRLTAPVSGEVLRVLQESETVVAAGTPLIEVADTSDLEVRADLLSTDAVQVKIGTPARIVDWGGPPLDARVTRVDPTGFEKTSALGIEELRVPVILELTSPVEEWQQLKHNFRVTAEVTLASVEDALLVPSAALFRRGGDWAIFAMEQGRARLRRVEIGLRNEVFAEVSSGLEDGEQVVLYPDERIVDGTRLSERAEK